MTCCDWEGLSCQLKRANNEMDADMDGSSEACTEYQPPNLDARINDLAIRCFRDIGDGDYIAARLALRARLPTQFLWAALQALEKYLKCILLLNRVKAKSVGHDIVQALAMVNTIPKFDICLASNELKVFKHIASSQGDRYLVMSLELFIHELTHLDALVWRLRQYCTPLDVEHYNDKPCQEVLGRNLSRIQMNLCEDASAGHLTSGFLEGVLINENHPARDALIWRNAMYGGNQPISDQGGLRGFMAINSPLYLHPEIVRRVNELIRLPKGALEAFEALASAREISKNDS